MARKLLTFLGLRGQPTRYRFEDGSVIEAPFAGAAIAKHLANLHDPPQVVVFVTQGARRYALEEFTEALSGELSLLAVDIPDALTNEELWETFTRVVDAVDRGDVVVFDVTHGYRAVPIIGFLAVAYLRDVKDVTVDQVLYGNLEAARTHDGVAPIVDLSPSLVLLDWMDAVDDFERHGDARRLTEMLRRRLRSGTPEERERRGRVLRGLPDRLEELSEALQTIRPRAAAEQAAALLDRGSLGTGVIRQVEPAFLPALGERIRRALEPLAVGRGSPHPSELLRAEREMIHWYLDRNLTVQALALAREWLISWFAVAAGDDPHEPDARRAIEHDLGFAVGRAADAHVAAAQFVVPADYPGIPSGVVQSAVELYAQISELRNDVLHAGQRPHPRPAHRVREQTRARLDALRELPLP